MDLSARRYAQAYKASAALLLAADVALTLVLIALLIEALGALVGGAMSLGIAALSAVASLRLASWLRERGRLLEALASCCESAIVHRAGREVCCSRGEKWVCIDLVYSAAKVIEAYEVEKLIQINPLSALNYSCAAPLGGGRFVGLTCISPNSLAIFKGRVESLRGSQEALRVLGCLDKASKT